MSKIDLRYACLYNNACLSFDIGSMFDMSKMTYTYITSDRICVFLCVFFTLYKNVEYINVFHVCVLQM